MLIKNRSCVYDFNFHLVFVTKYRKSIFDTAEKRENMKSILMSIGIQNNVTISNLEVTKDHAHMLISFKPKHAPASIVKSFKGTSAREWFKQYPETKKQLWRGHLWSPSYFMSTIGNVSEKIVNQYIENQMQKSFKN